MGHLEKRYALPLLARPINPAAYFSPVAEIYREPGVFIKTPT